MSSVRPPWTTLSLVALAAMIGCYLRGRIAASELLWLDELHTSWCVSGSPGEVAGRATDGNQSPFYFWLTWFFVSIFGHSELTLRSISISAGIGTLFTASWLTWRWTRCSIAATLVAWLIAIDANFVYYGSEARPYALLELLSVIQFGLFCKAYWGSESNAENPMGRETRRELWWHGWLALVSILLVCTHVTSVWLLLAESIFFVTAWILTGIRRTCSAQSDSEREPTRFRVRRRFLGTAGVVLIGCIPILMPMAMVYQRRGNWQAISSIPNLWMETWPMLAVLIGFPAVCLMLSRVIEIQFARVKRSGDDVARLALVCLWALIPIVSVMGMDYFGIAPMALPRYTLVGAVGIPVFTGFCLAGLSSKPVRLAMAGIVIAVTVSQNPILVSLIREQKIPQMRFEDWDSPLSVIDTFKTKSHYPVFLFANLIEDRDALTNRDIRFQDYLRFPLNGLYRLSNANREVTAGPTLELSHFDSEQIETIIEQGGAWAIVRGDSELVNEIGEELRSRTAIELGKPASEIRVSILSTPSSPVYALSIEW